MSKISSANGIPPRHDTAPGASHAAASARVAPSPACAPRVPGPGLTQLPKPAATRQPTAPARVKALRTLETRQRLHRLRKELGKIDPPPACAEDAHADILAAMARAGLGGWTLPALSDAANLRHADGSVMVSLVSHTIVFNAGGAFRIIDLLPPGSVYFELAGRDGAAFVLPCVCAPVAAD
ncbi:hypothetical protein LMG19089_02947 [Ralstonia edaphis]|uniref:hypothetical protein n=1 Tax=Ralstonia edaphi TaxID=3058599 RepID=UPI0028F4E54C|nr:hypothetical protein [Ralstonia sp. LMG 6871]CAJ0701871.1 hypothetical protein LMG19089_02947 [Ralstonia sp. LMG 6871]